METARHPFPVSSTVRTIGEQKANVKMFCTLFPNSVELSGIVFVACGDTAGTRAKRTV